MSYVNKFRKNNTEYDIQDARINPTSSDAGKVVSVDNSGDLTLTDGLNSTVIANTYSSTSSYAVGDIVIYNGVLYQCTASTTGDFDNTKWSSSNIDTLKQNKVQIDTTATTSITLANNKSFRLGTITTLTISSAASYDLSFQCELIFTAGTGITVTPFSGITWTGDDVSNGDFTPSAGSTYNILFFNNATSVGTPSIQAIVRSDSATSGGSGSSGTTVTVGGVAQQTWDADTKIDEPTTAGTEGQVLTLDSNLDPVWATASGGGGTETMSVSTISEFNSYINQKNPKYINITTTTTNSQSIQLTQAVIDANGITTSTGSTVFYLTTDYVNRCSVHITSTGYVLSGYDSTGLYKMDIRSNRNWTYFRIYIKQIIPTIGTNSITFESGMAQISATDFFNYTTLTAEL